MSSAEVKKDQKTTWKTVSHQHNCVLCDEYGCRREKPGECGLPDHMKGEYRLAIDYCFLAWKSIHEWAHDHPGQASITQISDDLRTVRAVLADGSYFGIKSGKKDSGQLTKKELKKLSGQFPTKT